MKFVKSSVFIVLALLWCVALSTCSPAKQEDDGTDLLGNGNDSGVRIGWAKVDISPTPEMLPMDMAGRSFHTIVNSIHVNDDGTSDNLFATALAIKSSDGSQAVLVSLDLIMLGYTGSNDDPEGLLEHVRERVTADGFDTDMLILFATHSHNSPLLVDQYYSNLPEGQSLTENDPRIRTWGAAYTEYITPLIAQAVDEAWASMDYGSLSYVNAVNEVGWNRISTYSCGHAVINGVQGFCPICYDEGMFTGFEARDNRDMPLIYTFDAAGELTGVVLNPGFPFHTTLEEKEMSADVMSAIRSRLNEFGLDIYTLTIIGAAGDQAPYLCGRPVPSGGLGWIQKTTVGNCVADVIKMHIDNGDYLINKASDIVMGHKVEMLYLEKRTPTEEFPEFLVELHAIRLGDIAVVNNPFELYVDLGDEIKEASKASMTVVGQLSSTFKSDSYGALYVPTERAVEGGAYGSANGPCGPAAGHMLATSSAALINSLFGIDGLQSN